MIDDAIGFVDMPAAGVRSDEAIGRLPQRVVRGKRLGVGDVEISGGETAGGEGFDQRLLIDGAFVASDVVENGPRLHGGETAGAHVAVGGGAGGKSAHDVVGL